jgi:hypothetical protein
VKKYLPGLALILVCLGGLIQAAVQTTPKSTEQTIYVRNISTFVSNKEVAAAIPAFQAAIDKDFGPIWNIEAKLVFIDSRPVPKNAESVNLINKADIPGALAYHELKYGTPDSKVFVGLSKYLGYSWQVDFTHELFEMLVDPGTGSMFINWGTNRYWFGEVCDPVESDKDSYVRDGVHISDFVTPRWFGIPTPNGAGFDYRNRVQAPGQIDFGGYAQYYKGGVWYIVTHFGPLLVTQPEGALGLRPH